MQNYFTLTEFVDYIIVISCKALFYKFEE